MVHGSEGRSRRTVAVKGEVPLETCEGPNRKPLQLTLADFRVDQKQKRCRSGQWSC